MRLLLFGIFVVCWALLLVSAHSAAGSNSEVTIRLLESDPLGDDTLTGSRTEGSLPDAWSLSMRAGNGLKFKCGPGTQENAVVKSVQKGCIQSYLDQGEYWQYEVCFMSNVSQIHRENGKIATRISLGRFASSNDTAQIFEKGSGGRSAMVLLTCDTAAVEPHITRWEEPTPLRYILHVGTKAVCSPKASEATLDSLACFDRNIHGYRFSVCPGRSVKEFADSDGASRVLKTEYRTFLSRIKHGQRQVELYESEQRCPVNKESSDSNKKMRVVYNCLKSQRHPVIQSLDSDGCVSTLRVGLAHVCNTKSAPVDCRQVEPANEP